MGEVNVSSYAVYPHECLPMPMAPPGINGTVTKTKPEPTFEDGFMVDVPAIGNYLKERTESLSKAIARRLSLDNDVKGGGGGNGVREFSLGGLQGVILRGSKEVNNGFAKASNSEFGQLKGRVTFFSRSNCRDSGAVRKMLREKGLKFVEINIDVYPSREQELLDRTGSLVVPQVFFNEKLIGGLVALNSLRNSGLLDRTAKELLGSKCPDDAPQPPVYGFDDPEDIYLDEMAGIVKVLRQRLPIQDRLFKLRIVKNCFTAYELEDAIRLHLGCSIDRANAIRDKIVMKHFIHHVYGGLYRFLEHEQCIPKCFNFRGSTNDNHPDSAASISLRMMKIMSAILESYASEGNVDYLAISNSEEFRRYLNLVEGLQRVDLVSLSSDEKLAFFLNLYNAMVIHAVIRKGYPQGMIERKSFVSDFQYIIGGNAYSLNVVRNGILRNNRRAPYALVKPLNSGDERLMFTVETVNPLIHFGLCDGAKSSPPVRFFTPNSVQAELRAASREFLGRDGVDVDLSKRIVYLTPIIKWYNVDFGNEKEILKWIVSFLDAQKAGLLTHLLGDGEAVIIAYKSYDWSLNI